jgi:hypothetical protein
VVPAGSRVLDCSWTSRRLLRRLRRLGESAIDEAKGTSTAARPTGDIGRILDSTDACDELEPTDLGAAGESDGRRAFTGRSLFRGELAASPVPCSVARLLGLPSVSQALARNWRRAVLLMGAGLIVNGCGSSEDHARVRILSARGYDVSADGARVKIVYDTNLTSPLRYARVTQGTSAIVITLFGSNEGAQTADHRRRCTLVPLRPRLGKRDIVLVGTSRISRKPIRLRCSRVPEVRRG